jgi:hypothetical protein
MGIASPPESTPVVRNDSQLFVITVVFLPSEVHTFGSAQRLARKNPKIEAFWG